MSQYNRIEKLLSVALIVILLLPLRDAILWAQEVSPVNNSSENSSTNQLTSNPAMNTSSTSADSDPYLESKKEKTAIFFNHIQSEISSNQKEILAINKNVSDTEQKLKNTQAKVSTLSEQVQNLDHQIQISESMIENVSEQMNRKEAEIKKLYYEIDLKKTEISFQKEMLLEYLTMLYKQQNSIGHLDNLEQEMSSIKLILGDESVGETLKALRYSEILEETGRQIFDKLAQLAEQQKLNQQSLEAQRRKLTLLGKQLQEQKDQLDVQKKAKATLLEETKGQEKIYQDLLDESKRQQAQTLEEIEALRKNLAFIQQKMKSLGDKFNPEDYAYLIKDSKSQAIYNYLTSAEGDNEELKLIWPVSPVKGISAYFRDQDYVKVIGMQHNAIDIRTPQGTPIRTPSDGIVFKAQDNGYGYSYIILAHGNGFMTVYGHVSEIRVSAGDVVKTGDIIGLSGATPGTKGAGVYTTGPHLHFEVLKGGKYQDPLNYLNLAYLPLETLPEKYLSRAMGDRAKVRRVKEEDDDSAGTNITEMVELNGLLEGATSKAAEN